jgi:DNA-directed RNA polymerase sigma subunit (sigma70/sigma32)
LAKYETIQSERRAEAKRMLEGYRAFCGMHDSMLKLMEDADSRLLSTTAQIGETRASSSAGDSIGSGLAKLETAALRLERTDDRICAKLDETLRIVERVIEINPIAGRVLSMRYLVPAGDEPTFEEIADALCYSADHIRHIHLLGLDIASIVAKEDTK